MTGYEMNSRISTRQGFGPAPGVYIQGQRLFIPPPASISLAICRWCDICIFNEGNKDVVVVVVVVVVV